MMLGRSSVDLVLVPSGLVIMFCYHLYLLYRILRHPETTMIGFENHNKKAWVARMLRGNLTEVGLARDVISSNVSVANDLASISIALTCLIGSWVGSSLFSDSAVIYGDTSMSTSSIKYISLIFCFLSAFTFFIQSTRHYALASSDMPVNYVQRAVIRGGYFWYLGLRALYFATNLLLWVFGPIPMFACSVSMVVVLYFLDMNSTELHHFRFSDVQSKRSTGGAVSSQSPNTRSETM